MVIIFNYSQWHSVFDMQITLRKRDLDPFLVEAVMDGLVKFMNRVQSDIHAGNVATKNEVQRTVAKGFEGNSGGRVVEHVRMLCCNVKDQFPSFMGVGSQPFLDSRGLFGKG